MSKAFLVTMIFLTFAAFGAVNYKINQDSVSIEDQALEIAPGGLIHSLPDGKAAIEKGKAAPNPDSEKPATETCLAMSLDEAKEIALSSKCSEGELLDTHSCNEGTKTWWIDLGIEKAGCSPACVINVETKTAEINWRCTGALIPKTEPMPASQSAPAGTENPGSDGSNDPGTMLPAGNTAPVSN